VSSSSCYPQHSIEVTTFQIQELKKGLNDPNAPFGVDLALPQVGGSARKTNVRS
jgi:hypothetical protein